MGQFRIEITATGGHGCQRGVKDGGVVYGCGLIVCPDCSARQFVQKLLRDGAIELSATLTHWPGTPGQVVDNLVTGERTGQF